MGTKDKPGNYDCYHSAAPDEPLFTLLARDKSAPNIVRQWANQRGHDIDIGVKPESDRLVVAEARLLACDMEEWYAKNKLKGG